MVIDNRLIQICSECKKSSCWHGEFLCPDSRNADLELKTADELNKLNVEDKHHYSVGNIRKIFGEPYPFDFKTKEVITSNHNNNK